MCISMSAKHALVKLILNSSSYVSKISCLISAGKRGHVTTFKPIGLSRLSGAFTYCMHYYSILFDFYFVCEGVATYCRNSVAPVRAEEGLTGRIAKASGHADSVGCYGTHTAFADEELQSLDSEGRAVMTQHQIRSVVALQDTKNGLQFFSDKPIMWVCPKGLQSFMECHYNAQESWLESLEPRCSNACLSGLEVHGGHGLCWSGPNFMALLTAESCASVTILRLFCKRRTSALAV